METRLTFLRLACASIGLGAFWLVLTNGLLLVLIPRPLLKRAHLREGPSVLVLPFRTKKQLTIKGRRPVAR